MNSEPALYLLIGKKGLSKKRPERNEVVLNERVVLNAPFLAVAGSAEGSGSEAEANSTKGQDKSDRFLVVVGTAPVHFSMQGTLSGRIQVFLLCKAINALFKIFSSRSLPSGFRKLDMKEDKEEQGHKGAFPGLLFITEKKKSERTKPLRRMVKGVEKQIEMEIITRPARPSFDPDLINEVKQGSELSCKAQFIPSYGRSGPVEASITEANSLVANSTPFKSFQFYEAYPGLLGYGFSDKAKRGPKCSNGRDTRGLGHDSSELTTGDSERGDPQWCKVENCVCLSWRNSVTKTIIHPMRCHILYMQDRLLVRLTAPFVPQSSDGHVLLVESIPCQTPSHKSDPWVIGDHYLTISPWTPGFLSSEATIDSVGAWVRVPNLPLEDYATTALIGIGDAIGKEVKGFEQVDSTGEFRDQNRSSIRSFFRADFMRSELRLGEREPEREILLIPAGNTLTYSWKEVSPLIRSSGSSLGRGGLTRRGIIPIGEMNLFSQIFFVVQLGICMNSCRQSQLEE
ncbi:hypothetical protein ACOSQ3_023019 [Xanthoceras sorbifolium]